jgi:hypothetical protein
MDPTQALVITIGAVLVIYLIVKSSGAKNEKYVPPTADDVDRAVDAIKDTDTTVSDSLTSGTGDESAALILYPGYFDKLTDPKDPTGGWGGWDRLDRAVDPTTPNKPDGSVNYLLRENYTFYKDVDAGEFTVTELDGSKQVPFAKQHIGGAKTFYFKSFKVNPGTMLMITCRMRSSAPTYGFVLRGRDCRDVTTLLNYYPELAGGNNGIYWDGWPHWEIEWSISAINKKTLHKYLGRKFEGCLDTALGIGNAAGDQEDPNVELGLHYKDGTRVTRADGSNEYGRWIYDSQCQPVVYPAGHDLAGKQMFKRGGTGWGQSCEEAYKFCALDESALVGLDPTTVDITSDGVPNWIGKEGVYSGISPSEPLADDQVGWTPSVSAPPPENAEALLLEPKPAVENDEQGTETFAPMGVASRFCDRSAREAQDYSESLEDAAHHSGYSGFTVSANTMRYRTALS